MWPRAWTQCIIERDALRYGLADVIAFEDEVGEVPGSKAHGMKHDIGKMLLMMKSGVAAKTHTHTAISNLVTTAQSESIHGVELNPKKQ